MKTKIVKDPSDSDHKNVCDAMNMIVETFHINSVPKHVALSALMTVVTNMCAYRKMNRKEFLKLCGKFWDETIVKELMDNGQEKND